MRIITLLLCYIYFFSLSAESFLTGIVQDAELKKGLSGVEVKMLKNGEVAAETISNEKGLFSLPVSINQNYSILFSLEGYEISEIEVENVSGDIDLGYCPLIKITNLQEITVNAERQREIKGKLLVSPTAFQTSISTKAIDLLGKLSIPGLMYSEFTKSVTVDGASPIILINGAPSTQDQLKYINAKDVLNVEFTCNVPPMYRDQGDCLINIRLKERNDGGSITVNATSDVLAHCSDGSIGFSYNQGKSEWRGSYSISHRNYKKVYDEYTENYLDESRPINICENDTAPFKYWSHDVSLQYTCVPNAKFLLQAKLDYSYFTDKRQGNGWANSTEYGDYRVLKNSHSVRHNGNLDFYARYDLNKQNNFELNIAARYFHGDNSSLTDYAGEYIKNHIDNSALSDRYSIISKLQYNHNFSDNSFLTFAYTNYYSQTENEYTQLTKSQAKDNFNYVGLQYQWGISRVWLSMQTGCNFNHRSLNSSRYWEINNKSWVNLSWSISSKWNTGLNVTFAPIMPPVSSLIAPTWEINPYMYSTNNPDLKQGSVTYLRWSLNFNQNIWNFSCSASYDHYHNLIQNLIGFNEERNLYYMRSENIDRVQMFNGYVNFGMNGLLDKFFLNCSFNTSYGHTRLKEWGISGWGLGGTINGGVKLGKWQIGTTWIFPAYKLMGTTKILTPQPFNQVAVSFKPNKHWQFTAQFWYLNASGWYSKSSDYTPMYDSYSYRRIIDNRYSVMLSVNYDLSFGRLFKTNRQRTINNRDNENGIVSTSPF